MPPLTRAEKAERRVFAEQVKANKAEREARRLANIEPNKEKVAAFVTALTELSKKHGVFVQAPGHAPLQVFAGSILTETSKYVYCTDPYTGQGYALHWQLGLPTKEKDQ